MWQAIGALALRVPLDPNEGWNAYHAVAATTGGSLYPDAASFMTDNYPPLSFYVVGRLGRMIGDDIIAGRILSLASFAFASCAIAMLAGHWSCSGPRGFSPACAPEGARSNDSSALFASLLFAASLLLFSDYVGMNDPQLFGHALQMSALLLLVFARRRSLLIDVLAAALLVTGLFVKHNLAALPFAMLVWIAVREPRRAGCLAALMLAMTAAGLGVFRWSFGFDLLSRLASPRTYALSNLTVNFENWIVWAAVPLAATLILGLRNRRDAGAMFPAIYAVTGTLLGLLLSGGAGVDANAMFDANIAIALGSGLAVARLRNEAQRPIASAVLAAALSIPFAVAIAINWDPDWLDADFWLHPLQDEAGLAQADIAWLKLHHGPVLCQTLALCYWAGKPAEADVFNLDQQFKTGARDEAPFLGLLAAHRYAAVQIEADAPFPLPARVHDVLLRNYRVARSNDDGVFYVPR